MLVLLAHCRVHAYTLRHRSPEQRRLRFGREHNPGRSARQTDNTLSRYKKLVSFSLPSSYSHACRNGFTSLSFSHLVSLYSFISSCSLPPSSSPSSLLSSSAPPLSTTFLSACNLARRPRRLSTSRSLDLASRRPRPLLTLVALLSAPTGPSISRFSWASFVRFRARSTTASRLCVSLSFLLGA